MGLLSNLLGGRFERLVERLNDMASDADAMMVSLSDMRELLRIAATTDGLQSEVDTLRRELIEARTATDAVRFKYQEATQRSDAPAKCETCAIHRRREEVLFEQLRAANIRLEGAGNGAVKLAQGVAGLIGSFLPAGTPPPSENEVSKRLGVFVPGAVPLPAVSRPSMFQEALDRLPELPTKKV